MKRHKTDSQLWDEFMASRPLAPATVDKFYWVKREFMAFIGDSPVGRDSVVDWNNHLVKRLKAGEIQPSYFNRLHRDIGAFLGWLYKMGHTNEKLRVFLVKVPEPRTPIRIITEEEYRRIWEFCNHRQKLHPHLWMITLSYRTGMTKVDCAHLRWKDVHLNDNGPSYIDIHRMKTKRLGEKSLCQIPLVPMTDVHGWLLTLHSQRHLNYKHADGVDDYVYQDCPAMYRGTGYNGLRWGVEYIFRQAKVEPGKTFRHLRCSFASNLVNSKVPIALIMKMTGHNNVQMLMKYLEPDRRALQEGLATAFKYASTTPPNPDGTIPTNVIQLPTAAGN